ncbi:MAG TPA: non-homologous end-joining DNA ligase [Gemmatimonadales bacterium]
MPRLFLLSPASTAGRRAALLFNPRATFDLATRLRAGAVPLGEVFSFLSGLYFRGKLTYARRFGAPDDLIRVITSDRGLVDPSQEITLDDLHAMSASSIDHTHEPYRVPLARDAALIAGASEIRHAILLGSVATDKYVGVLQTIFAERLLFPTTFAGRGDMSRGGLLLRCARVGAELDYAPVITSSRRKIRPPAKRARRSAHAVSAPAVAELMAIDGHEVELTNLDKLYWPTDRITKGELIEYYLRIAPVLLPHLRDRAMVMKRYPNGITGKCFFMKRAPSPRPEWIETCTISHASGNVIDFPIIQDRAALAWVVNLGCIDLNPWYARCDDVDRPDFIHFDLDPVPGASFARVTDAALILRDALAALGMRPLVKTTGSRGYHVYLPIVRGPTQKEVWAVAKRIAQELAVLHPKLLTAIYRVADRPRGHVLVDYNQNAWGRTLASIYSVRPRRGAPVSTPLKWHDVEAGVRIEDFTIHTVPDRVRRVGDLWKPLLSSRGRFDLAAFGPPARGAR